MAVLVNLVDRIRWQPVEGCIMSDIGILGIAAYAKPKDKSNKKNKKISQISLLKLNNVSLFREIQTVSASKYPGANHLSTRQSSPGNWNKPPGNSGLL